MPTRGAPETNHAQLTRRQLALALALPLTAAAGPLNRSWRAKLARLRDWQAQPGEVILFTTAEVNTFAAEKIPEYVPEGVRAHRVSFGNSTAHGFAYMDFLKMRHARGQATNWFLAKILEGERPVNIDVRMESANGWCTVFLTKLQVSSVVASGAVLDFMIDTFFLTLFPEAKVNSPFELDYNIDSLSLRPDGLRAHVKKAGWRKGPPPAAASQE
jgi:hypothetical protein